MTDIQRENNSNITKWLGVEFRCDHCGTYNPKTFKNGRLCLECAVDGKEKFYFIEEINKSTSGKRYKINRDFFENSNNQWECLEKISKDRNLSISEVFEMLRRTYLKDKDGIENKKDLFNAISCYVENC